MLSWSDERIKTQSTPLINAEVGPESRCFSHSFGSLTCNEYKITFLFTWHKEVSSPTTWLCLTSGQLTKRARRRLSQNPVPTYEKGHHVWLRERRGKRSEGKTDLKNKPLILPWEIVTNFGRVLSVVHWENELQFSNDFICPALSRALKWDVLADHVPDGLPPLTYPSL